MLPYAGRLCHQHLVFGARLVQGVQLHTQAIPQRSQVGSVMYRHLQFIEYLCIHIDARRTCGLYFLSTTCRLMDIFCVSISLSTLNASCTHHTQEARDENSQLTRQYTGSRTMQYAAGTRSTTVFIYMQGNLDASSPR